jgi:hypothetical protein
MRIALSPATSVHLTCVPMAEIGALKPWLRARGGASADANEREQGEEARQAQVYGFRMAARIAFSRSITPCGIQAPSSAARSAAILRTSRRILATTADSPSLSDASAAASAAGLRAGALTPLAETLPDV